MKFLWALLSKPLLFRQHWARSLPLLPFLLKVQCVHPFVSWQLFWHSWALSDGFGF